MALVVIQIILTLLPIAFAAQYVDIQISGLNSVLARETNTFSQQALYSTFGNATLVLVCLMKILCLTLQGTPIIKFSSDQTSNFIDGCSPFPSISISGSWIALVMRGNCMFVSKVSNAALAGASGIIIVDNLIR